MPGIGGGTREPQDVGLNQLSLEYSHAELKDATRNFDASAQIGHGSFGGVFRGIQKDGTEVAIKALEIPEEAGFEEEVRVLSKFRHPNLVILMGFARDASRRFLVYELLSGGDVYRRLQKCCLENVPFTWNQRVSVAFDASCGLSHLHHATPKVFHRDIKSPNILLDRNGTAKMADFGLACVSKHSTHKVKQASGTVGYACPFYVQRGVITEGSEVYSFGIVMLELLTASPPAYASRGSDGNQQYQFLVTHLNNDVRVAMSMCDPKAHWPEQAGMEFATLAFQATSMTEGSRPGFADIVNALRGLRDYHDGTDGQAMQQTQVIRSQAVPAAVQSNGPRYHDRGKVFANSPYSGQGAQLVGGHTPYLLGQQPQSPLGAVTGMQGRAVDVSPTKKQWRADQAYGGQQPRVLLQAKQVGAQQVSSWCVEQSFRLCGEGEEACFSGQARFLSRTTFTSVQSAAEHLNLGTIACPEGFCVVFSTSNSAYFLLYRSDVKDAVYAKFKVYEEDSPEVLSPSSLTPTPKADASFHMPALSYRPTSQVSPTLWTLECTYSEGTSLPSMSKEKRSLVHRQEAGGPALSHLRVGLLFQEEFLSTVVQDEHNRSHLCREHFQIWAEELARPTPNQSHQKPILCSFFLTNMSINGTIVNGKHVKCTNEQVPLHDGDIIALPRVERYLATDTVKLSLTPWLQFRFDLSRSILADGDNSPSEVIGAMQMPMTRKGTIVAELDSTTACDGNEVTTSSSFDGSTIEPACLGTSFVGVEMTPLFVLEVGGPAVRAAASPELRRIVHGVPVENESDSCPTLLLGRAQQSGFWQRVLLDEAYNSLSRQHLQIEVHKETSRSSRTEFCVRNLSELNPIRVCASRGGVEDGFDAHPALEKGETRALQHGDAIVVNPSKDHMLWLVFEHLSSSKLEVSSLGTEPTKRLSTASIETRRSSVVKSDKPLGQDARARRPKPKW